MAALVWDKTGERRIETGVDHCALYVYDPAQKTYGKGVVQTMLELAGGSLLKITTAHWYTPEGQTINKTGITPDVEVERSYSDINSGKDPQLDKAKTL